MIQILFGWDGDHLHEFTVGKKRFSAFARLEETEDEDSVRILDAAAAGGKIAYTYDFGTYWQHEITVRRRSRAITARTIRSAWHSAGRTGPGAGVKEVEDGDAITLMKLAFAGR